MVSSGTFTPKSTGNIPCPDMAEKMLTGTLNPNKQTNQHDDCYLSSQTFFVNIDSRLHREKNTCDNKLSVNEKLLPLIFNILKNIKCLFMPPIPSLKTPPNWFKIFRWHADLTVR